MQVQVKTAYVSVTLPILSKSTHLIACFLVALFLTFPSVPASGQQDDAAKRVDLTTDEREWLDTHPEKLVLFYNTEFPPIEFADADGEFIGLGADVIAQIEERLGVRFLKQPCEDWNYHLAALASGECAVAPTIVRTQDRQHFAYFTTPYTTAPVVIITDNSIPHAGLEELAGRRIAVVSGFATEEYLRDHAPTGCEIVTVNNVPDGLHSVSFGEADAFLENLAVAAYYIDQEGIPNLRVAGLTDYSFAWSIGVSRHYPELYSAVQKALDSIPADELESLRQQWIPLKVPFWMNPETRQLLVLINIFVATLILSLVVITYFLKRQLNTKVRSLKEAQSQLLRQTRQLSLAMEATHAGSWEINMVTGTAQLSQHWYTMLGYDPDPGPVEINSLLEKIHPDDLEAAKSSIADLVAGRGPDVFASEYRIQRADGQYCWVISKGRVISRDESGTPTQLLGMILDIQNIKEIQEQLATSEDRFRAIFYHAPYPIVITSLDTGEYLDANPAYLTRFDMTIENLRNLQTGDLKLIPDEQAALILDRVRSGEVVLNHPVEVALGAGQPEHYLLSALAMEINGSRQVLTMAVDVTETKRAEQTLRESEYRFHSFFASNPEGIILMDFNGTITNANDALLQSSGFVMEEIVGRNILDFIAEEHHAAVNAAMENALTGMGNGRPVELAYTRRDGTLVPISVKGWRMTDSLSRPVMLGVFVRDLTSEKQLEQEKSLLQTQLLQSQKMEAIGTLAGGIAHDFNNMLFAILGYCDMALAEINKDSDAAEMLREIITAAQRAGDLTRQILTFARRGERELQPVDLAELSREVLRLIISTLPKNIEVQADLPDQPAVVFADPSEMHQVLINLCTNAGHAMGQSGGLLSLTLAEVTLPNDHPAAVPGLAGGAYIKLTVADTGEGIPPEIQPRIFEPFFTTKERGEGTGMGLSVVHGIITELAGTVTMDSTPGRGSTFTVYIPKSDGRPVPRQPVELPVAGGCGRIMVVDDEESLAKMLGRLLRGLGYSATIFSDSAEALAEFKRRPDDFDLLLSDLAMPGLTGDQLAREAMRLRPELPVVICTGFLDPVVEASLIQIGVRYHLAKPLDKVSLGKVLREALDATGDQV